MQYYIFIAFFVGGAFLDHFVVEPVFFPRPEIVTVSTTTTTQGKPIPVPPLVATGDAVGVEAGEIAKPAPVQRPRKALSVPAVAVRTDSAPATQAPPKKYYQHPAPVGFMRGVSAVLNTQMTIKWEISGTGIPTTVPADFKSKMEVWRPDSIPEKTVQLQNTIITKRFGWGWIATGTVVGIVSGALLERYVVSKNGSW